MRDLDLVVLPVVVGLGFALVELHIQRISVYANEWFYRVGMFIVLSAPWVCRRGFWGWLFGTVLAFLSEDALYWLLRLTPPYGWDNYLVWHHIPLLYLPAVVLLVIAYVKMRRRVSTRRSS